jgi:hypothetical protein
MAGERDEIPRGISLEQAQLLGCNDLNKGTICNPNKSKTIGCNEMLL